MRAADAAGPVNVADLERLAAEALDPGVRGYFAGGAGDERTLAANTDAYRRWELVPRVLVDVSEVSTRCSMLGREAATPVAVAPVAFQRLAHPGGEEAMARAAEAAGAVMCVSTFATARPSDVAAAAPGGRRWLQLYCFRDRGVTRSLIAEAAESGYEAIVLTVDAPYAGPRERDLRAGFEVPAELRTPAIEAAAGNRSLTTRELFELVDPSLTWSDLAALVAECELPVLVKGVISPADAELAVEHGAAGVVVSNHGGRQLDHTQSTIEALPPIVDAVTGRAEIVVDGGFNRGTDVIKALARGARVVAVGRTMLWGLAADGAAGVARVCEIMRDELTINMGLCGRTKLADLTPDLIFRAD